MHFSLIIFVKNDKAFKLEKGTRLGGQPPLINTKPPTINQGPFWAQNKETCCCLLKSYCPEGARSKRTRTELVQALSTLNGGELLIIVTIIKGRDHANLAQDPLTYDPFLAYQRSIHANLAQWTKVP